MGILFTASALTTHFFHRRSRETVCPNGSDTVDVALMEAAAAAAESKQIIFIPLAKNSSPGANMPKQSARN